MRLFSELRYPTTWYTKLLLVLFALVFFAALATTAIAGFLVYRIVKPQRSSTEISMSSFPGRPENMEFQVPELGKREAWFFPGLRGASTIVLCHGYGSSRGELLTLVSALQDHQYNVFVFDFTAHGAVAGITTLGYREADELGLGGFPLMIKSAELSFKYLNYTHRQDPPLSNQLLALNGVPTLFIQALDDPELAGITREMFMKAPEPREQAILAHGNYVSMNDDDKRAYENRIVSFFLFHMLPTARPLH